MAILERFETKFTKADGCWNWTAAKSNDGYGKFWLDGKNANAHRVSYELYVGKIPSGFSVCHKCDNPQCVNPSHLFIGTHKENMNDMSVKGRRYQPSNIGAKNGMSKLTDSQVEAIKLDGRKIGVIATSYGVCHQHISKIKLGQRRQADSNANA